MLSFSNRSTSRLNDSPKVSYCICVAFQETVELSKKFKVITVLVKQELVEFARGPQSEPLSAPIRSMYIGKLARYHESSSPVTFVTNGTPK